LSIIKIEIDKGRSTVHEILIEIDKLIDINVKPRPKTSRELYWPQAFVVLRVNM
jgi:hypothetical protein